MITIKKTLVETVFSFHRGFPSVKTLLRLISENVKELYKNYLKPQEPCFDQNLEACQNLVKTVETYLLEAVLGPPRTPKMEFLVTLINGFSQC